MEGIRAADCSELPDDPEADNDIEVDIHITVRSKFLRFLQKYEWFLMSFGSAFFYAAMALLTSSLADQVSSIELTIVRAFVGAVFSLVIILHNGKKVKVETFSELILYVATSVTLLAIIFAQAYACQHMPVSDASAILYSYVALTGLFARIFLKDPFTVFELVMVSSTFAGILLIAQPSFIFQFIGEQGVSYESVGFVPPLIALIASIGIAVYSVVLRSFGKNDKDSMKLIFYDMLLIMIVCTVVITVFRKWSIPSCGWTRIRVFAVGISGFSALSLASYACKLEDAVNVSLVMMNDFLMVLLFSVIFTGFRPKWSSVVGMVLIFGSSVVILVRKMKKARDENGEDNS